MKTVTVRTYVVSTTYGLDVTQPTRDFAEAKAALIKIRKENPGEFYHLDERTEEVATPDETEGGE
jgi:hypothetical protein